MKQTSLPMQYWSDSFFTSIFLINRLPSKVLQNIWLHDKLFFNPLDYNFLRVFVCLWFHFIRPFNKHKLEYRSTMCMFIGYCSYQHGYICLEASSRGYVSRLVRFNGNVFPFAENSVSFIPLGVIKNTTTSLPSFYHLINLFVLLLILVLLLFNVCTSVRIRTCYLCSLWLCSSIFIQSTSVHFFTCYS